MARPLPLAFILGQMTADSREQLAAKLLTFEAARAAGTAAALEGHASACIRLGPANLARTKAARALEVALKGMTFEWVESIERDGQKVWDLRIIWAVAGAPAVP